MMGKQHETFPGEKPEIEQPEQAPEIEQPNDPKEPEVPQEDPQIVPDEYPPENNPSETPPQPAQKPAGGTESQLAVANPLQIDSIDWLLPV